MASGAPVVILRLAKVVSPQTILLRDWNAALAAGKPIRAFHDMTMAPAAVDTVARAIEALMNDRATGIFQLTGPRDVAYTEVGNFLAQRLGADASLVTRVSVADAGSPKRCAGAHDARFACATGAIWNRGAGCVDGARQPRSSLNLDQHAPRLAAAHHVECGIDFGERRTRA